MMKTIKTVPYHKMF